jgi:thiol-disulfide isomerase/thioredoxin
MKFETRFLIAALFAAPCMVQNIGAAIREVTEVAELNTILNDKKKPYTVIKFWKEECQPCEDLAPHFEAVAEELGDQVNFVSVEGPSEISKKYGIGGFPKTFYFKNGKKLSKDGTRNVNRLKDDMRGAFGLSAGSRAAADTEDDMAEVPMRKKRRKNQ